VASINGETGLPCAHVSIVVEIKTDRIESWINLLWLWVSP
jgi:hypothetical protein